MVRLTAMNDSDDYCDLCELPKSQCPHGLPPPPPPQVTPSAPRPRRRPAAPRRSSNPPPRPVTRRWTPPEVFKPHILTVLERAGGELEAEELFVELELRTQDLMRPEDSETTPEGELRWRYAARRARVDLIREGLMTKSRPGVWELAHPR